jgi:molecular chaperone GrpE
VTAKNHKTSSSSLRNKFNKPYDPDAIVEEDEGGVEAAQPASCSHDEDLLEHPSYLELQSKLTEAETKADQYRDRMLRMQAETDNIQRRVQRDVESAHKYGLEKFALELLPVIDSLERAVTLPEEHQHSALEGVDLTLKMFQAALEKFGIQQVDPVNQLFNPELHQAVSAQVDSSVEPNTVLNVLQKGYLLNNRLIRPALVIVSKAN